jgi:hypothetical protein
MWIILGIIFYWRIVTALEYRKDDDDLVAHQSTIFVATATIDNFVFMKGSCQDGMIRILDMYANIL